jgi:hypothetical protein
MAAIFKGKIENKNANHSRAWESRAGVLGERRT